MANNIWSDKKWVNITVNVLLFLLAINVFHYGQFILPIICLILFIDNRFKFNVNSWFNFILLCLFALSFCIFSFKNDAFYSLMGFCVPMAYYIGSNINDASEKNIKTIIYILAFGMATHVVLNFGLDFVVEGVEMFSSHVHRDIWTLSKIKATVTSVYYTFIIGSIYYLFAYEKNKKIKAIGISLLIILIIYDIGLGRRTPLFLALISVFVSIFLSLIVFKKKVSKKFIVIVLSIIGIIILFAILVYFNVFGIQDKTKHLLLIDKFLWLGLDAERLDIFVSAIKAAPEHLWGGQEISGVVGVEVHDLWMDVFDRSGIITYLLLVVFSIKTAILFIKYSQNKNISNELKILVLTLFICIVVQLFLEPIMSGSSLFLMCVIVFVSSIERQFILMNNTK